MGSQIPHDRIMMIPRKIHPNIKVESYNESQTTQLQPASQALHDHLAQRVPANQALQQFW